METKRVFIAVQVELSPQLRESWTELKKHWRDERIRWVPPENLHLTLQFLGELTGPEIERAKAAMEKSCSSFAPFSFQLTGLSFFSHRGRPSVIYYAIGADEDLLVFVHKLQHNLGESEIPSNKRFHPHLTLGRMNRLADEKKFHDVLERFKSLPVQQVGVSQIYLYESVLKPSGPEYRVLAACRL